MFDVADIVYVRMLAQLERQVLSNQQVVATLIATGRVRLPMPVFTEVRAEFDAALDAAPKVMDRDQSDLMHALGLR